MAHSRLQSVTVLDQIIRDNVDNSYTARTNCTHHIVFQLVSPLGGHAPNLQRGSAERTFYILAWEVYTVEVELGPTVPVGAGHPHRKEFVAPATDIHFLLKLLLQPVPQLYHKARPQPVLHLPFILPLPHPQQVTVLNKPRQCPVRLSHVELSLFLRATHQYSWLDCGGWD